MPKDINLELDNNSLNILLSLIILILTYNYIAFKAVLSLDQSCLRYIIELL